MKIDPKEIEEHAELAAVFLRALIEKGVPIAAAVNLTQTYVLTRINAEIMGQEPKPPWQGGTE